MPRSTNTTESRAWRPPSGGPLCLSRRSFLQAGAALVVPDFSRTAYAQVSPGITTLDLGRATLLQGAGCNVVAIPGSAPADQGALMIDGGLAANAEALLATVKRVHTLINTHWHPEQTGANERVGRSGGVILAHEKTALALSSTIYSSATFTGRLSPLVKEARPNKTVRGDGSLEFGGQSIDYGYMPAAHTDGDLYVHVPRLNLLVVGGVVSAEGWPLLDYRNGAWLGGRVRALQRLAGLVKPDTRVVPADGRVMTGSEIIRHRDMYQKLFTTMIGYLNMGLGPEDAVERNPLKEHTAEFGDPAAFTYGALRSMMVAYVPD